ncbi:nitrite transporter [Pantoea vagans]|uniref:nitrite transporter n=1 Tax=Pantoea vagans TaxID=470934 RepID=UPI00241C50CE|nr:nitrite transporter [Pantoea vagans]
MFNPEKYLSAVWLEGGRAFPEIDCFGLINEIRYDMGLSRWPEFAGVTKSDDGLHREALNLMKTLTRCEAQAGAGVACYTGSLVTHVAIVVSIDNMLFVAECNPKFNVTFMPLARFIRRYVKVEFWL